jgi:PPM family protein phosphatase
MFHDHRARDITVRAIRGCARPGTESPRDRVPNALLAADRQIRLELCREADEDSWALPASVAVAAYIDGFVVHLSWVGDCRAYLLRDGRVAAVTRDHSLLNDYLESCPLTLSEQKAFPHRRVVTRFLGGRRFGDAKDVEIDSLAWALRLGDTLLLCSSGVALELTDAEISQFASRRDAAESIASIASERCDVGATAVMAKVIELPE